MINFIFFRIFPAISVLLWGASMAAPWLKIGDSKLRGFHLLTTDFTFLFLIVSLLWLGGVFTWMLYYKELGLVLNSLAIMGTALWFEFFHQKMIGSVAVGMIAWGGGFIILLPSFFYAILYTIKKVKQANKELSE